MIKYFGVAVWAFTLGCTPSGLVQYCKMYNVPQQAQPCDHECAMAVAQGSYPSEYLMKKAYYVCLSSCPGVTITREPCN